MTLKKIPFDICRMRSSAYERLTLAGFDPRQIIAREKGDYLLVSVVGDDAAGVCYEADLFGRAMGGMKSGYDLMMLVDSSKDYRGYCIGKI